MATPILTAALAREYFGYDPETGVLTWRIPLGNRAKAGDVAGCPTANGYRSIGFRTEKHLAHRIIWLMQTGEWPHYLDHINGDRSDNRWSNLRTGTQQANMQNIRRPHRDNASGYLGVNWRPEKRRFAAEIRVNGRKKFIGYFDDPREAHEAYLNAKREHHPTCSI